MKNLMMTVVILALMPFAACTVCVAVNTAGCASLILLDKVAKVKK